MPNAAPPARPKTPEQPLSGTALTLLVVSATATMALLYLGLVLSLLLIGTLLLLELAGAVALLRFGLTRYMVGPIQAQTRLASLILQGLNLSRGRSTTCGYRGRRRRAFMPCFERAGAGGFYPEACVGLARIAYERKALEEARAHLLAALDVTREPGIYGHRFE